MLGVFNVGGEGFDNGLEVGVDVCRDTFSGGGEGGKNGTAIFRFVDLRKEVEGCCVGFGIEEKGCHPWISLGQW